MCRLAGGGVYRQPRFGQADGPACREKIQTVQRPVTGRIAAVFGSRRKLCESGHSTRCGEPFGGTGGRAAPGDNDRAEPRRPNVGQPFAQKLEAVEPMGAQRKYSMLPTL